MTLFDLALLYKETLLDKLYAIHTENNVFYIKALPKNFLHLTGLQRTYNFSNIDAKSFYNNAINDCYKTNLNKVGYKSKSDRNMVSIKSRCFQWVRNTILNCDTVYYVRNTNDKANVLSVSFEINNKSKYCTVLFAKDKEIDSEYYVPISFQIDQSFSYSIANSAYDSARVIEVVEYDINSDEAKSIIKKLNNKIKI